MLTEVEKTDREPGPRLEPSITRIRQAMADRQDALEDLAEAERVKLIALRDRLADLAADVPKEDDWVLLTLAEGAKPRFWVDATSHVSIGRDRQIYRFLRDTRLGRIVVRESGDADIMAQAVADYLAERYVEREKAMDGDWLAAVQSRYDAVAELQDAERKEAEQAEEEPAPESTDRPRSQSGLGTYVLGVLTGGALLFGIWAANDPAILDPVRGWLTSVQQSLSDDGQ